jgi:hypothetical protein
MKTAILVGALASASLLAGSDEGAQASSHREAPFITKNPKVDGTDFYMFRSYETGQDQYVTLVANYIPLQAPYGGPNFFNMDPDALYEIHIDNNGDNNEDLTFQFQFTPKLNSIALPVGPTPTSTATKMVAIPLVNAGTIGPSANDVGNANVTESYSLTLVRGDRRTGTATPIANMDTGTMTFKKPIDNIGNKSFPNYEAYARTHIAHFMVPGCSSTLPARVFVGQRKDPFFVNLGEAFDLINLTPGDVTGANASCNLPANSRDDIKDFNVTALELEVPIACLTNGTDPVIGAWTSASVRQARVINPKGSYNVPSKEGGAWAQVSRLGNPLVNELVIGLPDKDLFNTSHPRDDAQFANYVTNPTLPALIQILFGAAGRLEPTLFPRADLVAIFLSGVPGVTAPMGGHALSEQLRLNTSIPVTAAATQSPLGVLGGDDAGFPNGRRPLDDVTDVALRAVMGWAIIHVLNDPGHAPAGDVPFTDCARNSATDYDTVFPYLKSPLSPSPHRP